MVLGEADRLKALQSQIRQYESAYHPDHPTLMRLRRELETCLTGWWSGCSIKIWLSSLSRSEMHWQLLRVNIQQTIPEVLQSKRVIASLESSLAGGIQDRC